MEDRVEIATAAGGAPYTSLSLKSKRGAGFDVVVTEFFDANKADGGLTELANHDNLHVHVGLPSVDGCVLGLGHRELLNKRTTHESA